MARRKIPNMMEQQQQEVMNAQRMVDAMQQIEAVENQTRTMEQEDLNRKHDTQFAQLRDSNSLEVIGKKEIEKAYSILKKYKEEKSELESKIIENEEFWKMNHWNLIHRNEENNQRVEPKSAWLFNTIINKHADAMDNYPEANILPRAKDDEEVAKILSSIIPVIMEQNDYESTYSDSQWYKCKNGSSVQGVFWNNDKNNGLGDVEIKKIDILNLFWKYDISDIQDSPNVFLVSMEDNERIKEMYPDIIVGNNSFGSLNEVESYLQEKDDKADTTAVIDWYYKKRVQVTDDFGLPKIRIILHYCKFCNGQVIYASENDPAHAEKGWYDHGLYPFVFDTLFPVEKNVCGIGYIDVEKDNQIYVDKLQQAILESAIVNARPRNFIRDDGSVNEKEYLDISNPLIHVKGSLGEDAIRPVPNTPFNAVYETVLQAKIAEMKDTSGNTASSQGQTSNVTSASGIASLQEAAGKLSRDANSTSYRAYKQVVYLVIELIRQFYNEPRCFRITGEMGKNEFVVFDNSQLLPQYQGQALGIDLGSRLPVVDIKVVAQKKSAYTKETQNQTALNLYGMGFFAPANADAALACLDMMNFDDINKVKENVQRNGTMMQMIMQMQQQLQAYQQQLMQLGMIVDRTNGTDIAQGVQEEAQQTQEDTMRAANIGQRTSSGTKNISKGSLSSQAASATRGSTSPR